MNKLIKKIITAVGVVFLLSSLTGFGCAKVLVGGMPFGVKFRSEGIVVVGFSEVETESGNVSPAYDAGLRVNDMIISVNGREVKTSAEFIDIIEASRSTVEVTYSRGGNMATVSFTPSVSSADGKPKTGMWIRDTTAGIGTVTYIDPCDGSFAGLGHGICDPESGELLKMEKGVVIGVRISGVIRGREGFPGELKGFFTGEKSGVLVGNTLCGVYGVMTDIPRDKVPLPETETAGRDDVTTGEAEVWCTLDDNMPQKYKIRIDAVDRTSVSDNRSFTITVTDKRLLDKTGGIVQGMSGSPIIQNGKLIGAVTHVLVSDPTRGYGIFIENMLDGIRKASPASA